MNGLIRDRIEKLREVMKRERLSAFVFPSSDPHHSEYVPDRWKSREWISGFNGSAGTAVVTASSAALWTDSRYFISAENQLEGTGFQLMKLGIDGTPTIAEWLQQELQDTDNPETGIDGWAVSHNELEQLTEELRRHGGIILRNNIDPLDEIWTDRPLIPDDKVTIQPIEYAGESATGKLTRIRQALHERRIDGMLVSALDDIAWILNLRGTDVHCNPVFVAYLLIESDKITLFIQPEKITPEVAGYLKDEGVGISNYNRIQDGLKDYFEYNILLDPDETNSILSKTVFPHTQIAYAASPVPAMKAIKNKAEINGFHNAMVRDGVAMVRFLKWLLPATEAGGQTEMSLDEKLTGLRKEQSLFKDISFDTIVGYEKHGAIVHYEATEKTNIPVEAHGFVLIDSGAHYQDGTTDITRTIALGPVTDEQRRIYTLVLKAHIQLASSVFPKGANGTQIDALAREPLWRNGLNFLHGTGHGVGAFLNVHEGPHQIRMEYKPAPLLPGMTVTDEPGIYLEDRFGVRIENVLLVIPEQRTEFGEFLGFQPLTLAPIDMTPIITDLLTVEEKAWLNRYHQTVYDKLSPYLDEDEKQWLKDNTAELK